MVKEWAKENVTVNPAHVKLKCYGSMANGFAVPGSDMDLMLMFPKDEGPIGAIETECRRMLEKKILDAGYGARLLTKTRVPILRVCQDPSQELLDDLRQYRVKSLEQDREDEVERKMKLLGLKASRLPDDLVSAPVDLQQQLDVAASVPLPPSPIKENSIIEWDKTVGIQCDINFSNYVAVYNTQLLRCYCICDDRVRQLGLVVKSWVKARKINTPYFGTLSSYGYILMVLHYLMNVADPPVIPNLQMWAKEKYENTQDVPLFEGMDIRFMGDEPTLRRMSAAGELTRNQEPLGSLLRGFFGYYADPRGFHYTQEVVSIRTQGGILRKASKGWTEAKRAGNDNSIKLRYLLCIEDPFEIEHNIARTVGHHGIVAIRNEFRRAWEIVNRIEYSEESGWQWRRSDGSTGEDLFEPAEDRGDLLRKDTEFNRERTRAAAKLRDEKAAAQQQTDTKSIADGKSTAAVYEGRVAEAKVAHPPVKTSPSDIQDVEGHIHDGSMPAKFNNLEYCQGVKTGGKTSRHPKRSRRRSKQSPTLTIDPKQTRKRENEKSPSTGSTTDASAAISPETSRMPTPIALSFLSSIFDPNQLRDMQLNVEGGNGCSRGGPRGYELSGVFENAVNVSDLSSVAS
ncbi:putative zinc finger cchc domain containing [Phaeomoniella chlamydospora]|uniref:polynucleotide adenylyltransferase n=1 Tax=Phaeomoniella chlamydospora TaxID=158046 RepID=A0A0G2E5S3_PHACM|nr:putative zinc finger cchc domain containing [Phaeomoniella chlamydospora]